MFGFLLSGERLFCKGLGLLDHWIKTNAAGNENSINTGTICNGSIYNGPRYSPVTREDSCWSLVCIITSCLGFIFQWVIRTRSLQPSLLPSKAICLVRQPCFLPQYRFDCRFGLGNLPFARRYDFLHRCGYAVSELKVTLTRHASQSLPVVVQIPFAPMCGPNFVSRWWTRSG